MSWDWRVLPVLRLRGALALLFAVTFLATGTVTAGTGLLVRAEDLSERIPDVARYYVVVPTRVAGDARTALAGRAGVRVVAERRAGEILARTGAPEVGPDHLAVLEVEVDRTPRGLAASQVELRDTPGAVDVIDLNARDRANLTTERLARQLGAGIALLAVGCVVFVAAVIAGAHLAGRECRDEIGVRVLLGTPPEGLWGPLGLVVGGVALAGGGAALLAAWMAAGWLLPEGPDPARPAWSAVLGGASLGAGTLGLALTAARRAVARAARATVLAGLLAALLVAPAAPVAASPSHGPETASAGPVRDAEILRGLSRDLAVCRHALHVARKGLAATEHQAVRAAALDDEVLLRIAAAKRAAGLDDVESWEERCSALDDERERLRDLLRTARLEGPPITPRRPPVLGPVEVRYGQAGRRSGTASFRNGVALRTRSGEAVRATAPGRVAYAGDLPGSGPVVVIDHGRRTYSVYAKVQRTLVAVGQEVDAGETIARARTGLLYFSVRRRGRAVDPVAWVADAPDGSRG